MIPKPEFGDYHRFRVSVGLVLMAVGPIVFWFVLKESYDLFKTSNEISRLTPLAKWIVYIRQIVAAVVLLFSAIVGVWLFFIGFDMFREGDKNWKSLQEIHDELLLLERDTKKAGLQAQSVQEIEKSAQEDIESASFLPSVGDSVVANRELSQDLPKAGISIERYQQLVSSFVKNVRDAWEGEYLVLTNQKVRSLPYDIVLRSRDKSKEDVLIEARIWRSSVGISRINEVTSLYSIGNIAYGDSVGRGSRTILIFVTEKIDHEERRMIMNRISDVARRKSRLTVNFITEEDFEQLGVDGARRLVSNANDISFWYDDW